MGLAAEGQVTGISGATVKALTSTDTPCRRVWVFAPMTTGGAASNTDYVRVGLKTAPVKKIAPTDYEGWPIDTDNAVNVGFLANAAATTGQKMDYQIVM
jgi:hypothetical protein